MKTTFSLLHPNSLPSSPPPSPHPPQVEPDTQIIDIFTAFREV